MARFRRQRLGRKVGARLHWLVVAISVSCGFLIGSSCFPIGAPTLEAIALPPALPPPQRTVIQASDYSTLAVLYSENRTVVPLDRIPFQARYAVLAVEDRRFYEHGGVDGRSVGRAAQANLGSGERLQGGSTITEQYVKNLYFMTEQRTFEQKAKEAALALRIEQLKSKEQILEGYLNSIYFGEGAYGIAAAAEHFFARSPDSLDLAQSALLAGLIRAPETYNPRFNPRVAFERRSTVLEEMIRNHYISRNEGEAAKRMPLALAPAPTAGVRYPYFVEYVKRSLLKDIRFGETEEERAHHLYRGGLVIRTTLVPELQEIAESAAHGTLNRDGDPEAALTSIDNRTGQVVAMVGGRDFAHNQFNLAADARRQPGSAFKVFALVAALQGRIPPQTRFDGNPRVFLLPHGEIWPVTNYDGGGGGQVTLWDATVHSVNAAYAELATRIGPPSIALAASQMGIETPINHDYAMVLGGLRNGVNTVEMASAFSSLANRGSHIPPTPVTVVEAPGNERKDYTNHPRPAVPPGVAWMTTEILQEVIQRGTGRSASLGGRPAAGKTGTTSNHADAWFVGYTPEYSTAVWVGHPQGNIPMYSVHGVRVAGGTFPAQIWRSYMTGALRNRPVSQFPIADSDMVRVDIVPSSGKIAGQFCTERKSVELITAIVPEEIEECPEPASTPSVSDTVSPGDVSSTIPSADGSPAPPPRPWEGGG